MTNKQHQFSKLKYELSKKKSEGVKTVIWKLNEEQIQFIRGLGYQVTPELYEVCTKRIAVTGNSTGIVKRINRSAARGEKKIVCSLRKKELKMLEELNVSCIPLRYKIIL